MEALIPRAISSLARVPMYSALFCFLLSSPLLSSSLLFSRLVSGIRVRRSAMIGDSKPWEAKAAGNQGKTHTVRKNRRLFSVGLCLSFDMLWLFPRLKYDLILSWLSLVLKRLQYSTVQYCTAVSNNLNGFAHLPLPLPLQLPIINFLSSWNVAFSSTEIAFLYSYYKVPDSFLIWLWNSLPVYLKREFESSCKIQVFHKPYQRSQSSCMRRSTFRQF